jgi:hypothetical protein
MRAALENKRNFDVGAKVGLAHDIHGVVPVARFDGDEIGSLMAKVAGIKNQR